MSAIINFSLDVTKLPKDKLVKGKKGTYINLTLLGGGDTDQFGNNAAVIVAQTQEEREAGAERVYLGNGKVAWTDGTMQTATRQDAPSQAPEISTEESDDLPF